MADFDVVAGETRDQTRAEVAYGAVGDYRTCFREGVAEQWIDLARGDIHVEALDTDAKVRASGMCVHLFVVQTCDLIDSPCAVRSFHRELVRSWSRV